MADWSLIFLTEMLGTLFLILLGNGVVANVCLKGTKGKNSGWIVITAGWGLAVFFGALVALPSGAHLNPAVTFALLFAKQVKFSEVWFYFFAQILGAFFGQLLVYLCYYQHYQEEKSDKTVLGTFCTIPQRKSNSWNFITEVIGTFVLVFIILFAVNFVSLEGPKLFAVVGAVVFAIGLSLGGSTGYAINPVRDFIPRLTHCLIFGKFFSHKKRSSEFSYAWIPIFGPLVGASFAVFFIKLVEYLYFTF